MRNRSQRIERRVKLHDLRVLMSVVERGSMAKAAESLATSHYGRALIKRGIAIFDELEQGVQDIEFLADPTAGKSGSRRRWVGAPASSQS
jgi:DNA-binding transcriptional LysR family regulator